MADTLQVVHWSLERKCPFRQGADCFLPVKSMKQLTDLQVWASASQFGGVQDSICVTGWKIVKDKTGKRYRIPNQGYQVNEQLNQFGGVETVQQTCSGCEANVDRKLSSEITGCYGSLNIRPDSPEVEEQLWRVIEQRDLESRLCAAFPETDPLWYGLWIQSPLKRLQAEVLYELLDAGYGREHLDDESIGTFLRALKAAIQWELPLHVELTPLGHFDLGCHTIYPHCPRCKAAVRASLREDNNLHARQECQVCGQAFLPNDHRSSTRNINSGADNSLETNLGEWRYNQFARHHLMKQGCAAEKADELLVAMKDEPLLRQIADVQSRRYATIQKLREQCPHATAVSELPRHKSVPLNDEIDLELVLVPAGSFSMGSADTETESNAAPEHQVTVDRPFYIGRFPVTQAQWIALMGPSRFLVNDCDLPVDDSSWLDAQAFCQELCRQQRRVFRLPSEAEWEYVCRAGTTTRYAFSDLLTPEQANFAPLKSRSPITNQNEFPSFLSYEPTVEPVNEELDTTDRQLTRVGTYWPNAWGIYDMHGNVNEWCEDVWHPSYERAPIDGSYWLIGDDQEPQRVARGGCYRSNELACTSAARHHFRADAGSREATEQILKKTAGTSISAILETLAFRYGFRVVCEI